MISIGRILQEEAEEKEDTIVFPGYLKQLKLFMIQCQNAILYGSGKKGKESVFVRNMTELRRDVLNECLKREQASFLFAGLGVIAAIPVLFIPIVRKWGSENMPELLNFYNGLPGRAAAVTTILITAVCYVFLSLVRNVNSSVYRRPLFLRKMFECSFFEKMGEWLQGRKPEKWARRQLEKAGIYQNGTEYFLACVVCGMFLCIGSFPVTYGEKPGVVLLTALFAFFAGCTGMMGVYAYLAYLRRLGINGEVLGLQSIILMLFEAPNMTIAGILETMEEYAVIFQRELRNCADRYAAEEGEALKHLIDTGKNPEFNRLIHRLHISERLGLFHAFSELAADRQYFREQQRLDTEQELKKRAANAQVVAFVPMFFLLFAYLIFPFLAASLSQMSEIFSEMNQMKLF